MPKVRVRTQQGFETSLDFAAILSIDGVSFDKFSTSEPDDLARRVKLLEHAVENISDTVGELIGGLVERNILTPPPEVPSQQEQQDNVRTDSPLRDDHR